MEKLTGKQQRFVDEYIVCLNGTEAARRAGYKGENNVLAVQASVNLRLPNIARAIGERLDALAMPANEVLSQLTDIARDDISDAMNSMGALDVTEAIRRGKSHLIKRFKTKVTTITEKDGTEKEIVETEIEMHDRLAALQTLAKYYDLTNTIKVEDWRSEIIALYRDGMVTKEQVAEELGEDVAQELLIAAGISVTSSG